MQLEEADKTKELAKVPYRAFVRETDKDFIVIEVWGEGLSAKIGVFPKSR